MNMKLELKLEKSQKKLFLMNKKFQPIIFSLLLIIGIFLGKQLNKNDNISTNDKINSIINLINTNYVDSINENFEENIINSIIKDLDPHTSYISKENYKKYVLYFLIVVSITTCHCCLESVLEILLDCLFNKN